MNLDATSTHSSTFRKLPLVEQLQYLDNLPAALDKVERYARKQLALYEDLTGEDLFEGCTRRYLAGSIDNAQRSSITHYRANPILDYALSGHRSISDTFRELDTINRGLRAHLPRPLDRMQNQNVVHLEKLLGPLPELKANGLFARDNVVGVYLRSGVLPSAAVYGAALLAGYAPSHGSQTDLLPFLLGGCLLWGGISALQERRHHHRMDHEANARYLDRKIATLFS